jgi:hypothetical protein
MKKTLLNEISRTEDKLFDYVVTYQVPILSIDISRGNSMLVNAGLFGLLGFLYVKNSLVYLNCNRQVKLNSFY